MTDSIKVHGMDARFAGAQKVAERRRRRLAVEGDESETGGTPLPAPEGARRIVDSPSRGQGASAAPRTTLPLELLVPRAWWKYTLAAAALLLLSIALAAEWGLLLPQAAAMGAGAERSLDPGCPPLTRWSAGTILLMTGQLAMLVLWVRSQSTSDFSGRYRFWLRAAGIWFTASPIAATQLHAAWASSIARRWQLEFEGHEFVLWWAPAAATAVGIWWGLRQELRNCLPARILVVLGLLCYAGASAVIWQPRWLPPGIAATAAINGLTILGHASVMLSVWVFARHVIYICADPPPLPRRQARIPRPHFRLDGRKRTAADVAPSCHAPLTDQEAVKPKSRRALPSASQPRAVECPAEPDRISALDEMRTGPGATQTADADPQHAMRTETSGGTADRPQTRHSRIPEGAQAPAGFNEKRELPPMQAPAATPPLPVNPGRPVGPVTAAGARLAAFEERLNDDERDEEGSDIPGRPDLRGLSKKQRRKAMQEWRERQRQSRGD